MQEDLIRESGLAFSILRSAPLFELISALVQEGGSNQVNIPRASVQPLALEELAQALADIVTGEPLNRMVEMRGPERFRLDELANEVLTAYDLPRHVCVDPQAHFLGASLEDHSLLTGPNAVIARLPFADWLSETLRAHTSEISLQLAVNATSKGFRCSGGFNCKP
tara:strand:- start:191 stop:688 length:498 start_codon:yes stop_codon:yes gene_type:complete